MPPPPACTILPPHILRRLAEHGSPAQRDRALRALAVSERLRGRREAFAAMPRTALAAGEKRRSVYDAHHTTRLPGRLVRSEGQRPVKDVAVNEAYDGAGATYDFYWQVFHRNSVDDRGMRLDSTVHYGRDYDNAFWDGRQMIYGDGDGEHFQRFTKCLDVIGHELTHGVTQFEAALDYEGESGALNESFSDVFGSLVKQHALGQTAKQADWLIGAGLFTSKVHGVALRSMKAPGTAYDDPVLGKDPQPADMKHYVETADDNGGVHYNSGIPNHAFYLAAAEIGGHAWERAGLVWYVTLRDRLRPTADFQACANATLRVAREEFGAQGKEAQAVQRAWTRVGVPPRR